MTPPYQWYLCPEAFSQEYEELVELLKEAAQEDVAPVIEKIAA